MPEKYLQTRISPATAEAVINFLTPMQQKMSEYLANEDELIRILADGSARAAVKAEAKIAKAKAAMGLVL